LASDGPGHKSFAAATYGFVYGGLSPEQLPKEIPHQPHVLPDIGDLRLPRTLFGTERMVRDLRGALHLLAVGSGDLPEVDGPDLFSGEA